MQCEQARQLFDAYLDGELSSSLATELGAHRVRCADCRRALALLEVTGHILRSDRDAAAAPDGFTDRLLACVDAPRPWRQRFLGGLYVGGPLAAAAVIALAFLGVFDGRGPSQVAGVKQVVAPPMVHMANPSNDPPAPQSAIVEDPAERALNEFVEQTQQRMRDTGDSVQRVLDLTVLQMLNILEEAKNREAQPTPYFTAPRSSLAPFETHDVESLGPRDADSDEKIAEDPSKPDTP